MGFIELMRVVIVDFLFNLFVFFKCLWDMLLLFNIGVGFKSVRYYNIIVVSWNFNIS